MSEFWMSYEMIARRYGPGYQGYPLFGAVHLGELEAVAVCILLAARWYRRSPERTRDGKTGGASCGALRFCC